MAIFYFRATMMSDIMCCCLYISNCKFSVLILIPGVFLSILFNNVYRLIHGIHVHQITCICFPKHCIEKEYLTTVFG